MGHEKHCDQFSCSIADLLKNFLATSNILRGVTPPRPLYKHIATSSHDSLLLMEENCTVDAKHFDTQKS